MREPTRTFFSLHRTSKRNDAQTRLSALRRKLVSEQATRGEQMEKFWETCGHLGDYFEQHLHARHRLRTLNWQLRRWARQPAAARKTSLESELHRALQDGRSHEIHRLTLLMGGKEIGVRKRIFFSGLPGSRPEQEEMKTHVTMPGARGGNGRRSGRYKGNGTRMHRQARHATPRAAGHEHGDKSENDPFQNSEEAGKRNQTQGSATLECTRRASPYVLLAFIPVSRTVRETVLDRGGRAFLAKMARVPPRTKEENTRKKGAGLSWHTHKEHSTHHAAHTRPKRHSDRQT